MNSASKTILILILGFHTQHANASGQRSATISLDSVKTYNTLMLDKKTLTEKYLNYAGTVNNHTHILMVKKTSYSEDSNGNIGMPWNDVYTYKIAVDKMTIVNGWDLTKLLKQRPIEISPAFCPILYLTPNKKKYVISNEKGIKSNCLD
ncbi:MAG: hypothetical protein KAT06_07065 [Gammaproteobacteria bacterium]|nr:hypothetical protein [Gammaproteobacteria bacterium]